MSRQTLGSVHTPDVEHHRWEAPHRRHLPGQVYGRFDRAERAFLFEMRWRPAPPQHVLRITAWTLSIVAHLLFLVGLAWFRPPPYSPPAEEASSKGAIQVRLIQAPPPPPPPPPPPRLPTRHAPQRHPPRAPHSGPVALPHPAAHKPAVQKSEAAKVAHAAPPKPPPATPAASTKQAAHTASPPPVPVALPPPRVVTEVTPLSVPPPKTPSQTPAMHVTAESPDVPLPTPSVPQAETAEPVVGFQAPKAPQPEQVAPARVEVRAPAPPAPTPLQAVPQVSQAPATEAPVSAAPVVTASEQPTVTRLQAEAPPEAPMPAVPQAEAMPTPPLPSSTPTASVPALPDARPGPLALPTAPVPPPQPKPQARPAKRPASKPVAQAPAPSSSSWARTSANDRFQTQAPAAAGSSRGVRLYGKHGAYALTGGGSGKGKADYIQLQPHGNSDVMHRDLNPIDYKPTRFEQYWAPENETALGELVRRIIQSTIAEKDFHRTGVTCEITPLLFFGPMGCQSDAPSKPPSTRGDRRLDMAPAAPLVKGLGPQPATSSSTPLPTQDTTSCITAKVAGSPPPPGCPSNSPRRHKASDQW